VGGRVARECIKRLLASGASKPRVTVLGLTFKEDVPDIRNSKVVDIISELTNFGVSVQAHDPWAEAEEVKHEFGIQLLDRKALQPADAVILAVSHKAYLDEGWSLVKSLLKPDSKIVIDVKGALPRDMSHDFDLFSL
jgi:UDP-N-acetyl-D-glucosamine/UDP-N-acetyl-D-galactosamine dehydrogenase